MKHRVVSRLKWPISSLFTLLILGITFSQANVLSAHPPYQEGSQPDFVGTAQSSPDGQATIVRQEARLETAYFAKNGQMEGGLTVAPTGLTLASGSIEGRYTSGLIHSPLNFTTDIVPLWGSNLPEGAELHVESRLSLDGGDSWSDWLENLEAFYPVRDNLHSGNLIWVGAEQAALQFRVSLRANADGAAPTLTSLTLAFSDTSQGPDDGELAAQIAQVSTAAATCPVEKPAVVSRTDWGCPDGQNSPRHPPKYAPVTHIVIHQTETPNNSGPYQDYAGWVRSIWNFHANVLWWGDVGYNYLVDPNGLIYEGRAGGDDVVGIHDGFNVGSMAIGFIGCYGNCDNPGLSVAEPSQAMLDSTAHLIAWKLGQKDIDPFSSANYNGMSNVPVIAGGRDVAWTSSPGDNVYNKLPHLREQVAENNNCSQQCQITDVIFGQESYQVNDTIDFTVRLADFQGTPLTGAEVTATREITPFLASVQASTGFGFVDRGGEYDGLDSDTQMAGLYSYTFTASDPTDGRFTPCTATASVQVGEDAVHTPTPTSPPPSSTPTPMPTDTPIPSTPTATPTPTLPPSTPTAIPTPTPTPPPSGTVIKVNEPHLTLPMCSAQETVTVKIENVSDLFAVQLELEYDPVVVQVVDADPDREGVQVRVDSAFSNGFIAQNTVDTTNGRISFAATLLASTLNGNIELISIDLQPQAVGNSALSLENVILARPGAEVIDFTPQNGTVAVTDDCVGVGGVVTLQGRVNHSGVTVTAPDGQQSQTNADGSFSIEQAEILNFSYPGYLSAQATVKIGVILEQVGIEADFRTTSVGSITLLAGDVNSDNVIDILDLTYLSAHYRTQDMLADLNADGIVNILDLALAANNYGQQGPLTDWK